MGCSSPTDLPLRGDPASFPREFELERLDPDFSWPWFSHFFLGEHHGHCREAAASFGLAACSVADRRTTTPPSAACMHFIGTIRHFVELYPHPMGFVQTHFDCAPGSKANRGKWASNLANGTIRAQAHNFAWGATLSDFYVAEQPHTALEFVYGPPAFVTNTSWHGSRLSKWWLLWMPNQQLPLVSPSNVVPESDLLPRPSTFGAAPAEVRMLLRSATPVGMASALAAAWSSIGAFPRIFWPSSAAPADAVDLHAALCVDLKHHSLTPSPPYALTIIGFAAFVSSFCRRTDTEGLNARLLVAEAYAAVVAGKVVVVLCDTCSTYDSHCACSLLAALLRRVGMQSWVDREDPHSARQRRLAALPLELQRIDFNLQLFTASYAPSRPGSSLSPDTRPCVVVVPVHFSPAGVACVFASLHDACFAAELNGLKPEELAADISRWLPCTAAPIFAAYAPHSSHLVFVAPCASSPFSLAESREHLQLSLAAGHAFAWCSSDALSMSTIAYSLALMAIARISSIRRASKTRKRMRIGIWEGPRPVVAAVHASTWRDADASPSAMREWLAFLEWDDGIAQELKSALLARDGGCGKLVAFALKVRSASDLAHELPVPPQGLPDLASAQFDDVLLPERPLPLVTDWLVYADQPLPPGCMPQPWANLLKLWGRREVCDMLNAEGNHLFACWRCGSSDVHRKPCLCLGPGAMMSIPHADGIGTYLSTDVIWKYCDSGEHAGLFVPLDFNELLDDHKNREELRRLLGATTDQEMLSLCIHGMR